MHTYMYVYTWVHDKLIYKVV